jgi:hypothetical protein
MYLYSMRVTCFLLCGCVALMGTSSPANATCRTVCTFTEQIGTDGCCSEASVPTAQDPIPSVFCPDGQLSNSDTNGHCCWPGQAWNGASCVGTPTSCPPGWVATADACQVPDCEQGQQRATDGASCCWPGQAWSTSLAACVGDPICGEATVAYDGRCVSHDEFPSLVSIAMRDHIAECVRTVDRSQIDDLGPGGETFLHHWCSFENAEILLSNPEYFELLACPAGQSRNHRGDCVVEVDTTGLDEWLAGDPCWEQEGYRRWYEDNVSANFNEEYPVTVFGGRHTRINGRNSPSAVCQSFNGESGSTVVFTEPGMVLNEALHMLIIEPNGRTLSAVALDVPRSNWSGEATRPAGIITYRLPESGLYRLVFLSTWNLGNREEFEFTVLAKPPAYLDEILR